MGAGGRPEMPYGWGRVGYSYEERWPWMNLPFPVEEYHRRLARLRQLMAAWNLDAMVVMGSPSDNSNIRYLTNFEVFYPGGRQVVVVPANGEAGLTTDGVMHGEPMHSGIQDAWLENVRCAASPKTVTGSAEAVSIFDHVEDFLLEAGLEGGRLGLVAATPEFTAFLESTFPRCELVPADAVMIEMRKLKSPLEIEALRKAAHLADAAMQAAMDAVRPGVTEFDIAAEAVFALFREQAEHLSFPIAVTAGPRSGFKHMAPTDYTVRDGDLVYIDVGGRYMGYYSDCSRQCVCGTPNDEQLRFMEAQIDIVEACTDMIRPGTRVASIAEVGLDMARSAGYEEYLYFRGHGIGCATHDLPSIAPGNPAQFEENMVFCFEPMLVRKEFGTACWEDMWRVTVDGVERLNRCQVRWW
ncbi:MAG: Xaa-Pro peptidase family protein [Truepera sp.]|nr:Xaa-Pro peptidase family protein [Truepera sp.]